MLTPYERDIQIIPTVVGFAEGVFVIWNYLWNVLTLILPMWGDALYVDDQGNVHLYSSAAFQYYFYAGGVGVLRGAYDLGSIGVEPYGRNYSLLNGYIAFRSNAAVTTVNVFNAAGLVWTRNTALDVVGTINIRYVAMSPSGEYLAVMLDQPAGADRIALYQGA